MSLLLPAFVSRGLKWLAPTAEGLLGQSVHALTSTTTGFQPSKKKGYIEGLVHTNNGTDANNDIDFATGYALSDDATLADRVLMNLASAITKRLDASWVVGTNQGGLDTGAKANSTWYATWLIMRSDTLVVDVLFSASFTSPTMPANYDCKALIGQVRTDGSGNIIAFKQKGDFWEWATTQSDISTTSPTTGSDVTFRPFVPPITVFWIGIVYCQTTGATRVFVGSADTATQAINRAQQIVTGSLSVTCAVSLTDSAGQLKYNAGAATYTGVGVLIQTYGYDDLKGRC